MRSDNFLNSQLKIKAVRIAHAVSMHALLLGAHSDEYSDRFVHVLLGRRSCFLLLFYNIFP
jgi:hypothetical protein